MFDKTTANHCHHNVCSCRSMGHIHFWCFNEYFVCLCFKFDCFKICIYVSHFLWGYL